MISFKNNINSTENILRYSDEVNKNIFEKLNKIYNLPKHSKYFLVYSSFLFFNNLIDSLKFNKLFLTPSLIFSSSLLTSLSWNKFFILYSFPNPKSESLYNLNSFKLLFSSINDNILLSLFFTL